MGSARVRDTRGIILIELLVVMVLTALIFGIVVAAVYAGSRTEVNQTNRLNATESLRTAVERVARDVRVADPLEGGNNSCITVDLNRAGTSSQVIYWVANGILWTDRLSLPTTTDCGSLPSTPTTCTHPTTGPSPVLCNVSGTNLFSYFDDQPVPSPTVTVSPTPLPTPLANISYITNVTVNITEAPPSAPSVNYSAQVELRNHQ